MAAAAASSNVPCGVVASFGRGRGRGGRDAVGRAVGRGRGLRAIALQQQQQQPGSSIPAQCITTKSANDTTTSAKTESIGDTTDTSTTNATANGTTTSAKTQSVGGTTDTYTTNATANGTTTTAKTQSVGGTTNTSTTNATTNGTTTKEKTESIDSTNTSTTTEKTHCREVIIIMKRINGLSESQVLTDVLPVIEALDSEKVIEDLVHALSEKALTDTTFAVIAAKISHKLWENETMHSFVRNPLLTQTQAFYDSREKLEKENKYHCLCIYLCHLFKLLRIRQKPLIPMGGPVMELLKGLIERSDGGSPSNDDVKYFYQELEGIGGIMGEHFPAKLEELINLTRQMVISSSLVPSVRCRLIQLVELHAAKWVMEDKLKTFYNDLLLDLKTNET